MEERIKRTGKKDQPEKQPLKAKERSSNQKPKTAKEPVAKSVDATDAPKPDLAALRAMARPQ